MDPKKHNGKLFFMFVLAALLLLVACGDRTSTALLTSEESPSGSETPEQSPSDFETPEESLSGSKTPETGGTEGADRMFYAHVNGSVLKILPAENVSAEAFLELLKSGDVTVEMRDYGRFEKVGPLGTALPRSDEQITTEPGDVILYQGDQVTIYYDVNSWRFTRLGKVQDRTQAELKAILGEGNASVTFSLNGKPQL